MHTAEFLPTVPSRMAASSSNSSAPAGGVASSAAAASWSSLSDAKITSISGSVSGFAATFAKQPIQRLKWIRQVDSGTAVPYNELLRRTIREDGVLGLFRGSVAGIMRNVPHSALVYTIYPQMEAVVLRWQQQQLSHRQPPPQQQPPPPQQQQQRAAATMAPAASTQPSHAGSSSPSPSSSSAAAPPGGKVAFSTRFWAGYATLFFATLITHPLDTLRVRLSVTHGEAASTPAMIRAVVDTGGIRALYQGFGATLVGAGPRGALGFGVFETLKDVTSKYEAAQHISPTTQKLLFGYLAGICAETAICTPLAAPAPPAPPETGGPRAPQAAPQAACSAPPAPSHGRVPYSLLSRARVADPLDTVRRRQQALGDLSPLGRLGQFDVLKALVHVARAEGVAGMFKGLSLNLVKNPIATAVSFTVNDLVKELLRKRRRQPEHTI